MEEEKNAFYVVRKGDVVGVYRSLSDCQAQVESSLLDPLVSVYKGYCLPKEAEEFLMSRGLKNASYTVGAADVKNDTFGNLVHCPVQAVGSPIILPSSCRNNFSLQNVIASPAISSNHLSCIIEFDGASKGNPGQAGAGAVLRADNGSVGWLLREGVGIATNNVAEYRAVILGLRNALQKGFKHVEVYGDSQLVCMQIQGLWKTKNQNMADLCNTAKELRDQFASFEIRHIGRERNSAADAQANLAVYLRDGQVEVDHI